MTAVVVGPGCARARAYARRVKARDLAEPFPTVSADTDALVATRMLAEQGLPGLVVLDSRGRPLVILAASQVLRFAIPDYIEEDPALAGVIPEATADQLCSVLAGKSIAELMPAKDHLPKHDRDRPIVTATATVLQVASVMSHQHSPMVAVMDHDEILGVITVHRLLGALLPPG